jgi:hypothetical protein
LRIIQPGWLSLKAGTLKIEFSRAMKRKEILKPLSWGNAGIDDRMIFLRTWNYDPDLSIKKQTPSGWESVYQHVRLSGLNPGSSEAIS